MTFLRSSICVFAAFAVLLFGWQLVGQLADPPTYLLPMPVEVLTAGWESRGSIFSHALVTVAEAAAGMVAGSFLGLVVAVLLWSNRTLRQMVEPVLVVSQSVPAVVLAPLFVVWFGFGLFPKLLIVALVTFFPVVLAALSGFDSVDRELTELFRSYRASWFSTLIHLYLPSASEEIFAGLKIAASYAIFGAVIGEWMGATEGLGVYLERSRASFRTDQIFAAVAVIAMCSLILYGLVTLLGSIVMPWKNQTKHKEEKA